MSDPLPPTSSPDTDDTEAEAALLFARCSPATADAAAQDKSPSGLPKEGNAPNVVSSHLAYRHLVISLSTSLIIGLLLLFLGRWFYLEKIEPRLSAAAAPAPVSAPTSVSTPAPAPSDTKLREELAKSAEHIRLAAFDYAMDHYMGKTAQVHAKLRGVKAVQ